MARRDRFDSERVEPLSPTKVRFGEIRRGLSDRSERLLPGNVVEKLVVAVRQVY